MCLCLGRSTPEMRAIGALLALPLFVAWVFTNDPHDALAADHLALVANLLDARSDFHGTPRKRVLLLVTVSDAAAGGVVGADFDRHAVTRKNTDVKLPHSAADRGEHHEAVVALHAEHCVRQCLLHDAVELKLVAFGLLPLTPLAHE